MITFVDHESVTQFGEVRNLVSYGTEKSTKLSCGHWLGKVMKIVSNL